MQKQNSTLTKKIKGYSALAVIMLGIAPAAANAQIVYTDVDPDSTDSDDGASYALDLNNDGTMDFMINVTSQGAETVKMTASALGNNAIAGTTSMGGITYKYPSALNLNATIGASKTWVTGGGQTMASTGYYQNSYGKWFGADDKYMGLRLEVGGDIHYGWLRLDVSADGHSFTVKDYAYVVPADTAILAGDPGSVGITTVQGNEIKIFAIDKQITVELNETASGFITVSNVLGQLIKAAEIESSHQTIHLADQATGVYVVTVVQNGKVFTRQVTLH